MKTGIAIGLIIVGLLVWPQYEKYQEKQAAEAQWAAYQAKERAKEKEFWKLVCRNPIEASHKQKCKENGN